MNPKLIDFLNSLKNASCINKEDVFVKYNSAIFNVLKKLYREGHIQSFTLKKKINKTLIVKIKYFYNKSIFKNLETVSKVSNIKFLTSRGLMRISTKKKILYISTDKGILTLQECKKKNLGGVLLFVC